MKAATPSPRGLGKRSEATRALAGRTVARVSTEEHMANYYQAARALMGKDRNAGEGAAGLQRVTHEAWQMRKLDLAKLEKAFAGK